MKALSYRMPVPPPVLHSSMPTGHPEGLLVLKPATSSMTFVLSRGQGESTGAGPRWPQNQPLQPDKLCSNQTPRGPQSRMQTGISLHRGNPHRWFTFSQVFLHPFSYSSQSSAPFRLLNITNSTIWRGRHKPKTFDQDVTCKRSPKPGSSKYLIRSVIFGDRPGFKPYCDYLLASLPLTSCLISLGQFLHLCNGNSTSCEERL